MRFAERFLVALAILSLIMRYFGMKDGPTLELIALPLLAVFYVVAFPIWMQHGGGKAALWSVLASIPGGLIMAYCILSALFCTLHWLPKQDMLENCCLLLGALIIALLAQWRKRRDALLGQTLLRTVVLLALLLLLAALPLPQVMARH